jgi:hypothetical protein
MQAASTKEGNQGAPELNFPHARVLGKPGSGTVHFGPRILHGLCPMSFGFHGAAGRCCVSVASRLGVDMIDVDMLKFQERLDDTPLHSHDGRHLVNAAFGRLSNFPPRAS